MNTYKEIIKANGERYCGNHSWWSKYAFHYTDITNAVSIINSGTLYSRSKSTEKHLMHNDNASCQVIDMSPNGVTDYVRFYFRPLTPTQYHNEGYKHPNVRYSNDLHANVPLPIFFLFDLQLLLEDPNTLFSEKSQAGIYTPELLSGILNFEKMNFSAIYADGPMSNPEEDKKYRHAEILYPEKYAIENSLRFILVRNEIDKMTLMHCLRKENPTTLEKFKSIIRTCKEYLFELNGLYISSVTYYKNKLHIVFNDVMQRRNYARNYSGSLYDLQYDAVIKWGKKGKIIDQLYATNKFNYLDLLGLTCNLPSVQSANTLELEFRVEGDLICDIDIPISETEIF